MGVLALCAGTVIHAQDYDDIYYDGSKSTTEVKQETKKVETTRVRTQVPTTYKVTVEKNYQTERDVDEYNRRGGIYSQPENDTLYLDAPDDGTMFGNTQRIERFYNPDIVVLSDDDELVELYYDNAPSVNLIIGTNYGYTPRVGWGFGYGNYWPYYAYDPFYDPFYDLYYTGWYGWRRPYYGWYSYYGWSRPYWHYSWGWGGHYGWGWDTWGRPWGHHGPHMWSYGTIYHNTNRWHGHHGHRLPGDNRSLLSGSRRGAGTTAGIRGTGGTGRTGAGTINNGRTRPSTLSGRGMTTGRTRPSSAVGNINRSTGTSGGYSGGSVRSRGTNSSGYSGSSSRSSSRSSSYSGGSRSSGYSSGYSGGSRSSGYSGGSRSSGYSGGSRSSGGFSGGSSRGSSGGFSGGSRGGGGGGGRRH